MTIVLATQFDGPLRCLREREPARRAAAAIDTLATDLILVGCTAQISRRDLLQLAARILSGRVIRPRVRVNRLAAALSRAPRQMFCRISPDDFASVPRHVEYFGRNPRRVVHGQRSDVADALPDIQLAVGFYRHETVEANRPGRELAESDRNAGDLAAVPLAVALLPFFPVECGRSLVERLAHERAGEEIPLAFGIGRAEARA